MPYATRRIWNPAMYQGGAVTRRYFEGWYFKQVDAAEERVVAIIPGVAYSPDGSASHAFVQLVPSGGEAHYFAFPIESFSFDPNDPFSIRIAGNTFSRSGMALELSDAGRTVSGTVGFGPWWPWPVRALSPGIMGWYRFVPRMETYHGVLSMDHELSGSLTIDGEHIAFDGGRGYLEKDWGRSFPSSWIWAQSNHFGTPGVSLTVSVAKVPWMGGSFVGNIAGLLLDGELHRFTTYTGAKPLCVETGSGEARIVLADRHEEIEIELHGSEAMSLAAPILGDMEGRDAESLGGTAHVTLRSRRGGHAPVVFEGTGRMAGIEIMNDKDEFGAGECEPPTAVR
ncbi:MAG: tocopherol cyclase family protein [Coriobacteriia bacterium]|nr:tocopherol cyclase family protein [Coriobacteriia bacterium]